MKFYPTLLILVLLHSAISIGRSEVSDKQLQGLVDESTLTFIGTVKEMGIKRLRLSTTRISQ